MNSYFNDRKRGVLNMRSGFWNGIIAGSIIGAAISMMAGGKTVNRKKGLFEYSSRRVSPAAKRMFKGFSKTVNNIIK